MKAASCVPAALLSQSCLLSSGSELLGSYRLCCAGCGSAQTCATRNLLQSVLCITPQVHTGWRGACSSRSSSLSLHSSRWISLSRSPTIRWYSLVLALLTPYSTLIIESIAKRIAFSTTRTSSSRRCACRLPVVTEFILFYRLITFVQLMGHQKRCDAKKKKNHRFKHYCFVKISVLTVTKTNSAVAYFSVNSDLPLTRKQFRFLLLFYVLWRFATHFKEHYCPLLSRKTRDLGSYNLRFQIFPNNPAVSTNTNKCFRIYFLFSLSFFLS